MIITSQAMGALIEKYKDFILVETHLNKEGIKIYKLIFENNVVVKCKIIYKNHKVEVIEI